MKISLVLLYSFLVIALPVAARATGSSAMKRRWFEKMDCEKLRIVEYRSVADRSILKEVLVEDAIYLKSLQKAISQLPTEGDLMIKMGPDAGHLVLEFSCGQDKRSIQFYDQKIQTPSTGFISHHEPRLRAEKIWREIRAHLDVPAFGNILPKVKGQSYQLDDLKVAYLGTEDRTPSGTTASRFVEQFKVTSKKGELIKFVEVMSGQLPPRPEEFQIENFTYVLKTWDDDGTSLAPRLFVIRRK